MYDEWKDTDAVFNSIVFLDCVAQEFLELTKDKPGFEKARRGTERGRPLGLGALGYHTYLQQNSIPFESTRAREVNIEIFQHIRSEAERATKYLAGILGEPEYCKGLGRRNTHVLAVAPNTSSALLCGGVSQGIEPIVANVYNQVTAAGEIYRVNPVFLTLAKARVGWDDDLVKSIIENNGSVQHLEWLTEHEKEVFKTAYEINQYELIDQAAARQVHIDQGQSLNTFFDADAPEEYISGVTRYAFKLEAIKALYYMRTKAGVQASSGECTACEG
jgi:ribonucleoside-diphosphate reductase alpha chain